MARSRKDLVYKADPKPYRELSDEKVVAMVRKADQIRELAESLESENAINYEAIDHFIALYKGTVDLGIPEGKRFVDFDARSGKAPDIIHRAMGMLMSPLNFHYVAPNKSIKSEDHAANIQRHLTGAYEWMRRKYQQQFDLQSLFWQLLVGKGYIQQTFLPNYWDKNVRRRKSEEKRGDGDDENMTFKKNQMYNVRIDGYKGFMGPPVFVEALDPRTVFPVMTAMGPRAWVKKYKVQRYEVEDAFADAGAPIQIVANEDGSISEVLRLEAGLELPESVPTTNSHEVVYYELIDDEFVHYVIENKVIHRFHHKGGIKIVPAYGLITGFKEFEMMAVSILYAVRHELPQFDFLRTLWANRAFIDVFPQLFAELEQGMDPLRNPTTGDAEVWDITPMTIKQVRGKITNAFKDAQAGVDYRALIEEMAADIDLSTISGLARGVGGAQQPGYAINQLSQAMRTIWKPVIESRQLQWSMLAEHYLWCLKHLVKEETTVFSEVTTERGIKSGEYLSIEPDDIQDFFQVIADLSPDLPIDTQGNMLTWAKMGMEGWATDEEVSREGFGKPDWKVRRAQAERDRMRRMMLPDAMADAVALGKVRLQGQVASDLGLDKLNAPFQQDLATMRQGAGGTPTGGGPGQNEAPPPQGATDPAGAAMQRQQGPGIQPTVGANPNQPAPASRR